MPVHNAARRTLFFDVFGRRVSSVFGFSLCPFFRFSMGLASLLHCLLLPTSLYPCAYVSACAERTESDIKRERFQVVCWPHVMSVAHLPLCPNSRKQAGRQRGRTEDGTEGGRGLGTGTRSVARRRLCRLHPQSGLWRMTSIRTPSAGSLRRPHLHDPGARALWWGSHSGFRCVASSSSWSCQPALVPPCSPSPRGANVQSSSH